MSKATNPINVKTGRKLTKTQVSSLLGPDYKIAIPFLLPLLGLLLGLVAIPFISSIWLSFHERYILGTSRWIGIRNYVSLLEDSTFQKTLKNTGIFTSAALSGKVLLGLALALVLNKPLFGRNLWRALMLLPWVTPTIVAVINWGWIFNDYAGFANYILRTVGILRTNVGWLGKPNSAMFVVVLCSVWRDFPFFGILIHCSLSRCNCTKLRR